MTRRFLSSEQLLRKCSEIEIMSGCLDIEPIRLNYDDPFLSNEANNSLLENKRRPKNDKFVRNIDEQPNSGTGDTALRSDLSEVKRILRSMTDRRTDQPTRGGYNRYNRETIPSNDLSLIHI